MKKCIFCCKEVENLEIKNNVFESKKSLGIKYFCNVCKEFVGVK